MRSSLPVYAIDDFYSSKKDCFVYVNKLENHLKSHKFINKPHRHDFYLTVLFTHGKGNHHVDFEQYSVRPGSVFFLSPGQTHNWELSPKSRGYVFFHNAKFYALHQGGFKIADFPFFSPAGTPILNLKKFQLQTMIPLFQSLLNEHKTEAPFKTWKMASIIQLLYIGFSRYYATHHRIHHRRGIYLDHLQKFIVLADKNYKSIKLAGTYADMLNMTEKHLNRICRQCLDKTPTEIITEKTMLEAKRLLTYTSGNISEVAEECGYHEVAYFSKVFKKTNGLTPLQFRKKTGA